MTEKELMKSLVRDTYRTEEEIIEFCEFHSITLLEYREQVDRAIAARRKPRPADYPLAKIIYPSDPEYLPPVKKSE